MSVYFVPQSDLKVQNAVDLLQTLASCLPRQYFRHHRRDFSFYTFCFKTAFMHAMFIRMSSY